MWFIVIVLLACGETNLAPEIEEEPSPAYPTPELLNDGLMVADPDVVGMNPTKLLQINEVIDDGTYQNIHSVLVAREGLLIYEAYFEGAPIYGDYTNWGHGNTHNMHSVSKSITSALIGIAIEKFKLSVDDRLIEFFPDVDSSFWSKGREEITVEHLLTMSAGFEWDEWTYSYDDERNDHSAMYAADDWVHFVITRDMQDPPGTQFAYNSGLSITLGEIIDRHTGTSLHTFANSHLFFPLGIRKASWFTSPSGIAQTGGGLRLTPRDMLKIGLLFANDGIWNEQRIISEEWVRESTTQQGPNRSYGYQWWLRKYAIGEQTYDAFMAQGRGGQYIIVIKELSLVAVFTAGNDNIRALTQTHEIVDRYILRSLKE